MKHTKLEEGRQKNEREKTVHTITIIECEIHFHETKSLGVFITGEVKCIDMKNRNEMGFLDRNK